MRSHLIVMFPLLLPRASADQRTEHKRFITDENLSGERYLHIHTFRDLPEEVKQEKETKSRTVMAEKRDSILVVPMEREREGESFVRRVIKMKA